MCSRLPVNAASTASACTFTFVCIIAARCGGSAPIRVGCTPFESTRHGTSTVQPAGRLSIRPWFATLPYTTRGCPVSRLWMIPDPYSWLRWWVISRSPFSNRARSASHSAICSSQRVMYSSIGTS